VGNGRRDRYGAVRDWMTKQPAAVGPDCSIADAMARMRRANVRHLLVVDAGRLVGIVSHRDWRRVEVRAEAGGDRQPVTCIMTEDPVTVAPETAVIVAARELLERKIGCLPVRDGEEILGIFTTSDALEALLSALD
jgi:acetoin utilization protein AcuB